MRQSHETTNIKSARRHAPPPVLPPPGRPCPHRNANQRVVSLRRCAVHVEAAPRRSRAARLGAVAARQRVEIEHHAIFGPRTATPTGTARSRCSRRLEVELARGHERPGDQSAAVARGKDCERGDTGERGGERSKERHAPSTAPPSLPVPAPASSSLPPRSATRSCQHRTWLRRFGCQGCGRGRGCCSASLKTRV